jgi:hypothetical protein
MMRTRIKETSQKIKAKKEKKRENQILEETTIELLGKTYTEPDTIARRRDVPRSTLPTKIKALP